MNGARATSLYRIFVSHVHKMWPKRGEYIWLERHSGKQTTICGMNTMLDLMISGVNCK